MRTKLHHVAKLVRCMGFPVKSIAAGDSTVDGDVTITKRVHVQVGNSYVIVGYWDKAYTGVTSFPEATSVSMLREHITKALARTASMGA